MTNSKTTKRALFSSFVSLLLCFTMLMGATFAWFTDNVSSTGNRIQAGTLEVDLVMDKFDGNGYLSIADGTGDIFSEATGNGINWEPGKTEIVYLGVQNDGSLALKYNILLDVIDEGLIGSLEYAVLDGVEVGNDLYNQLQGVSDWETLKAINGVQTGDVEEGQKIVAENGVLDEIAYDATQTGETDYFALAVHMKEDAGDEYQGDSITIDVKVFATQKNAEIDSFGPDYDKDAELIPPIKSAEDLKRAAVAGGKYGLAADIEIEEGITVSSDLILNLNDFEIDASANASRPLEMADGASLTINGGDEEVKVGAYGLVNIPEGNDATVVINGGKYTADTAAGSFIKPRGDGEITIVLKDVEYTDNSATGRALDATSYSGDNLNVVVEGGNYKSAIGFVMPSGSITGATIATTQAANMFPAVYSTGDVTIENCTIVSEYHALAVSGGQTLNVKNCNVTVPDDCLAFQVFSSGGTINVFNTTYTGKYGTTGKMNSGRVAIINIDGVEVYRKG